MSNFNAVTCLGLRCHSSPESVRHFFLCLFKHVLLNAPVCRWGLASGGVDASLCPCTALLPACGGLFKLLECRVVMLMKIPVPTCSIMI